MGTGPENPYFGVDSSDWPDVTWDLVGSYPLSRDEIVDLVLDSWARIMKTRIAGEIEVGSEVRPTPQMLGNFLHVVMAATLEKQYPGEWRKEQGSREKDLVYIPDDYFSTELKTSSSPRDIFGNRSYASPGADGRSKSGYYIAVNYERYAAIPEGSLPQVTRIALGWLNHSDWIPQAAESGQQARLSREAKTGKFIVLYSSSRKP